MTGHPAPRAPMPTGTAPGSIPGEGARLDVARRLPADVSAAGAARDLVADLFDRWRLPERCRESAQLVASELASNAVEHGSGPIILRLERRADRVRIAVADAGSGTEPTMCTPTTTEPRHRGLFLVAAVSLDWGQARGATGHAVWADIGVEDTVDDSA